MAGPRILMLTGLGITMAAGLWLLWHIALSAWEDHRERRRP